MNYIVEETNEDSIKNYGDHIRISVQDFSNLSNFKDLITKIVRTDKLLKFINFPETIISLIIDTIVNDSDIDILKEKLTINKVPLYSLIINLVNNYKQKYIKLLEFKKADEIIIICNKDNFSEALEISKKLNKIVTIDGRSISLLDYKKMLSNYDLDSVNNVRIMYQERNSLISIKELYNVSIVIADIIENIKKYNLTPLEEIIYVYDLVKSREYKECNEDKMMSRDLDKVIQGSEIVCVGYSNLFNAILKSLNFNCTPIISIEKKHQRSMVYIKDSKYHIDGLYAFDPTWDSRKNDDYIDNYKYFALTLNKSEKDVPSTQTIKPDTTFNKLVDIYSQDSNIDVEPNQISELEKLFGLIEEEFQELNSTLENYTCINYEEKEKARRIFNQFIKKYNAKEIPLSVFMKALLNTRIIEYYNGITNLPDIEDIIDASKTRTVFQTINYDTSLKPIEKILETIEYSEETYETLNKIAYKEKESIDRRILNIRLLKVLRNRQK